MSADLDALENALDPLLTAIVEEARKGREAPEAAVATDRPRACHPTHSPRHVDRIAAPTADASFGPWPDGPAPALEHPHP